MPASEASFTLPPGVPHRPVADRSRKGHVLVVEDWQPNVLVISLMLEMHDYSFDIANDGMQAMELFRAAPYDAVLMDIRLPDMLGYEISTWMREYEKTQAWKPAPIIATTAYAMRGDREKCLASGMTDYLSKPLDSEKLNMLLQHLIGTRH